MKPSKLKTYPSSNVVRKVFPKSCNVVTTVSLKSCNVVTTMSPKSTDAPAMELVEAFSNVGFETKSIRKHSGGDEVMELVESLKNVGFK